MLIAIILIASISFQFIAAYLALRLIKVTGIRTAWILIAMAFVLMAIRRCLSLYYVFLGDSSYVSSFSVEFVALLTSILLMVGMILIVPLLSFIKHSEQILRTSKEKLDAIINNTPNVAIEIYDIHGKVLYWNKAAEKIFGWTQKEAIGKTLDKLILDEKSATEFIKILMNINETNQPVGPSEWQYKSKNGVEGTVYSTIFPIHSEGGKKEFICMDVDITDRKRIEKSLVKSERLSRAIIEHSPIGISVRNKSGELIIFNDSWKDIWDLSNQQIIEREQNSKGKSLEERYPYLKDVIQDVQKIFEVGGELFIPEIKLENPNTHTTKWISQYLYSIKNENGEVETIVTLTQDITNRKIAEEEIIKLNGDLKKRADELELANKELEAFSYTVSHDLRSPLITIDGFSQSLLRDYAGKLGETERDYIRRICSATQHMSQLINDLLNLSRVTLSEMHFKEVNISVITQIIADNLKKKQPDRKVEFIIAPDLIVKGDENLIYIMMENLLDNAWKFTNKHLEARIEFGSINQDDKKVYFVKDNGVGFDMAHADKLFGPFQRLHKSSDFPGTGIGLATVQRIINRHKGKIWAESEVNKGAIFYFTMP